MSEYTQTNTKQEDLNTLINSVNELNSIVSTLIEQNNYGIVLLDKVQVSALTGWSSRTVIDVFNSPELRDSVIKIGKKGQIENGVFLKYLQSGPKRDESTYWLNKINWKEMIIYG